MTGKEEQNELAVPAIKASARLLLMGSPAHSSQQYFSLMSQVSLSGSCKLPTLSHSHYGSLCSRQLFLYSCTSPSSVLPSLLFHRHLWVQYSEHLRPRWSLMQYLPSTAPCFTRDGVSHVWLEIFPLFLRLFIFPLQK